MKKQIWKVILAAVLVMIIAAVSMYFFLRYTTYEHIEIVKTYENQSTSNEKYVKYSDGVLEYSRDGIAMLSETGEEIWNQPCQMQNPTVAICENAVAVADKSGTSIFVFQREGLKGEIQTTRPIEKIAVSAQGIVAAMLKDEETPRVMCYDAAGNLLIEHKASLLNTGYPVDVAISPDGNVLLVSYLCVKGNGVSSKVVFYNFGEAGEGKDAYQVAQAEYEDVVIPTTAFLGKDLSLAISDQSFVLYKGLEEPEELYAQNLDKEIKSVAYNEKYIAMVLKNSEKTGYELRLYGTNGKQVMSATFEGEYSNIKIAKDQIFLYDGNKCMIYNDVGICKYEGSFEVSIIDIFPTTGLNQYMVINANGFREIQLAK